MRQVWFASFILLAASAATFAQQANDYHRFEVAGSFVYAKMEPNSGEQFIVAGPDHFSFLPCTTEGLENLGQDLQGIFCLRRGFKGSMRRRLITSESGLASRAT